MQINLSKEQKEQLELKHKSERDVRICDRIKAVLLNSEGWNNRQIAQALRIHEETVFTHLADFINLEKLKPLNGGSESKLDKDQTSELIAYLTEHTLTSTIEIQQHIFFKYQISYSLQGIYSWLITNDFSYKKPKGCPAKADKAAQLEFIKYYQKLKAQADKKAEPILFIDSVHPTMETKISYGWIRKGTEKIIKTTASRTRVNLSGAIELKAMKVIFDDFETIDGDSTVAFLTHVRKHYDNNKILLKKEQKNIHIILDNSGYHRSNLVKNFCKKNKIKLHFLPPYSPNLNPIERLWKVMNERTRDNQFFSSAKEFREKIHGFFTETIPMITDVLQLRITDKFHVVSSVTSS